MKATATEMKRALRKAGMRRWSAPALSVHRGVAVWSGGASRAAIDVWFHPALGDSHLCFREAFSSSLPAVSDADAKKRKKNYPDGWRAPKPYLR